MADEIVAAVIQGVCTIAAAGLAVVGALSGLESWQKDAPGRRRLELAETCLATAYEAKDEIGHFSYKIRSFMRDDIRLGAELGRSERSVRREELYAQQLKIGDVLKHLQSLARVTDLYFDCALEEGHQMMQDYYSERGNLLFEYERLCDSDVGVTPKKEELFRAAEAAHGTPESDYLYKVSSAGIDFFEGALKKHLGILVVRKTKREKLDERMRIMDVRESILSKPTAPPEA